jgi:RNA polymerase sigma-70 factor (ECF subfamily)
VETQPVEFPPHDPPPHGAAGDDTLQRARHGDLPAFRELLRAHKTRVFSMALRILGNGADAEEVAQDVFLQLHGALAPIATGEHLKHWLLRAVSHRCIDRLRSQGSRPRLVPMAALPEDAQPTTHEPGGDHLAIAQIHRLLPQLAPEARAVLLLRYQEDLVPSEIATVLAIPVNTVKSHLRRSLDWLRAQLAGDVHGS